MSSLILFNYSSRKGKQTLLVFDTFNARSTSTICKLQAISVILNQVSVIALPD